MTIFTTKRTIVIFLVCCLGIILAAVGFMNGVFSFVGEMGDILPLQNDKDPSEASKEPEGDGETETVSGLEALIEDDTSGRTTSKDDFFTNYRLERERVRAQQVEMLNSVIADPNSAAEVRKNAQEKLIDITENMEHELQLENLIMAKGFSEAAMFIQSGSATAILKKEGLAEDDVSVVADIISRVTGYNLEDIVVIPK